MCTLDQLEKGDIDLVPHRTSNRIYVQLLHLSPPDPPPPSTRSRHGMYLLNKRMCTLDQMRDLKKKNGKPFSCFAYMLVLWVDYSIGEYSLMSYTGCSRLPQSKAAAVGQFQEDQWAPIDRVGEFTSAFFFPIDQVKKKSSWLRDFLIEDSFQ